MTYDREQPTVNPPQALFAYDGRRAVQETAIPRLRSFCIIDQFGPEFT